MQGRDAPGGPFRWDDYRPGLSGKRNFWDDYAESVELMMQGHRKIGGDIADGLAHLRRETTRLAERGAHFLRDDGDKA